MSTKYCEVMIDNLTYIGYTSNPECIGLFTTKMKDHRYGGDPIHHTPIGSLNQLHPLYLELRADNSITISGSIHKYFNRPDHTNDTDFTWTDFAKSLQELFKQLNIDPKSDVLRLKKIEIGINYELDFEVAKFLECLNTYKNKNFSYSKPKRGTVKKWGKECNMSDYTVKFYNKAWMTNKDLSRPKYVEEKLLRFEVAINFHPLRYIQCKTVSDLLQSKTQVKLFMEKVLKAVKFYPYVDYNTIEDEELFCIEGYNSDGFKVNTKGFPKVRKARLKRKYERALLRAGADTERLQSVIDALIRKLNTELT